MTTIDCGTLVDGVADEPRHDVRIRIADGRIDAVGDPKTIEADEDHHDYEVVIPGLVDAHIHLAGSRVIDPMNWVTESVPTLTARATADCRKLLAAGFTSVRDVGSATGLGLKQAISEGTIPGPRVYTSGKSISQTAGHGDTHSLPLELVKSDSGLSTLADGEDECRRTARERIREGVDCIKIMTTGGVLSELDAPDQSQFTDGEIRAFTEEAHRVGIPVASHAQGTPGVVSALKNGVDTIEHGFYLDSEAISLFHEHDATFVPTLAIMHRIVEHGADHEMPEWGLRKAREAYEAHVDSVKRAYEADVAIALGTDFIGPDLVPHGENALEAELLVDEIGLSEMEAIKAGTSVAARTVFDDDVGHVEEGARADLVALDANPLEDISALRRNVVDVFSDGERADL